MQTSQYQDRCQVKRASAFECMRGVLHIHQRPCQYCTGNGRPSSSSSNPSAQASRALHAASSKQQDGKTNLTFMLLFEQCTIVTTSVPNELPKDCESETPACTNRKRVALRPWVDPPPPPRALRVCSPSIHFTAQITTPMHARHLSPSVALRGNKSRVIARMLLCTAPAHHRRLKAGLSRRIQTGSSRFFPRLPDFHSHGSGAWCFFSHRRRNGRVFRG